MPPADRAKLHTPGIRAMNEHHRSQMHDQLLRLCHKHLSIWIKISEGTKIRRADSNLVGQYPDRLSSPT